MARSNVFWTKARAAELQKHRNDSWDALEERFGKSGDSVRTAMRKFRIHRDRKDLPLLKYTDAAFQCIVDYFVESQKYRRYAPEDRVTINALKRDLMKEVAKTLKSGVGKRVTWEGIRMAARQLGPEDMKRIGRADVALPLLWTNAKKVGEVAKEPPPSIPTRRWQGFTDLQMDAGALSAGGIRVGCMSRIDYKSAGYRAAMVVRGGEIFASEGIHFGVIAAGLLNKKWSFLRERIFTAGRSKEEKETTREILIQEWAKELSSVIPRLHHPVEKGKFIKWYVFTSASYDGPIGERLAQRLGEVRRGGGYG